MTDLVFWLLTTYAVGLAAMPVAYIALPNLTDRGFGLIRPIGMLVFGSLVWMLSLLKILPNVSWSWWLIALLVAAAGWAWIALKKRTDFVGFLKRRWLQLILTESVFLAFFCVFAFVKALDPDISHTEKPMDLTMLNAVISAQHAPPTDLWLSGYPIAYYYFGYWMLGGIAQMSGVQASIAYNLALATVAAMSAAAIFSLVSNLVRRDGATTAQMLASGLIAAGLLLLISNLNGLWELLSLIGIGSDGFYEWLGIKGVDLSDTSTGWRPEGWWWWWASSRVINRFLPDGTQLDFTIQEFPYFSLMLGDLHPHVMSIPFVLTGVSVIANLLFSRVQWGIGWLRSNPISAVVLVLVVGSAGFINTWDMLWLPACAGRDDLLQVVPRERSNAPPSDPCRSAGVCDCCFGRCRVLLELLLCNDAEPDTVPTDDPHESMRLVRFTSSQSGAACSRCCWCSPAQSSVPTVSRELAILRRSASALGFNSRLHEKFPWVVSIGFVAFTYFAWIIAHYSFNDNARGADLVMRFPLTALLGAAFVGLFVTTYRRGMRGADDGAQPALIPTDDLSIATVLGRVVPVA